MALLAETCRNIGADAATIKSSNNSDHVKNESRTKNNCASNATGNGGVGSGSSGGSRESNKCSFKPYEESLNKKSNSDDINVCDDRKHRSNSGSSTSSTSKSSSIGVSSDKNGSTNNNITNNHMDNPKSRSDSSDRPSSNSSTSTSTSKSGSCTAITYTSNGLEELAKNHSLSQLGLNGTNKSLNCNGCLPSGYPQISVDNVNKFVPYPSLSPYLSPNGANYANHLANGHCASPSLCRDAFCSGCRVTNLRSSVPCPSGCTQCSHGLMGTLSSHLSSALQPTFLPSNAFYPLNTTLGKPNICSWMVGGTYCGKSFQSSEELLQHLRTHTSSTDPATLSSLSLLGHYPSLDPMLTSPIAGLRRTAFDPVNRYHPYKPFSGSPVTSLPSGLSGVTSLTSHPTPPLNMHYPSYGPYASRLGPPIPP